MEYRAGEVLSLAVGFKCCWEANQGVEGSENAPEQLKAFCFSVRAQARNRDSPHMAGVGESGVTLRVCACCSSEYVVDDPPRVVMDKLEKMGYYVQSMTGVGQTLVWCLHKRCDERDTMLAKTL